MSTPIQRVNKLTDAKPMPANYTIEPEQRYRPEYWLYLLLIIVAIVILCMGGHQVVAQYQASTGVVLTNDDIASVQASNPNDMTSNSQVTIHLVLTDAGARKFAAAKPRLPIYFKGEEIGVYKTFSGHTADFQVSLKDAAKIKLQLNWRDNS